MIDDTSEDFNTGLALFTPEAGYFPNRLRNEKSPDPTHSHPIIAGLQE